MSNSILPMFPGLSWGVQKRPIWSTNVADAISGRQYSLRRRLYPVWQFRLPYEVLRANASLTELQQLVGFYNQRNGRYDDFLYLDPRENTATTQPIGTGDGVTTAWELLRSLGSFSEPVGGVASGSLQVYLNGVLKTLGTDYTLSSDWRVITFTAPPGAGVLITWTGTFYYRCRFVNDYMAFDEFLQHKWKTDVEFRTYRP